MEKEVVITYETLFEILRREKAREDLQKLPENFAEDVKKYLHEKKQSMLSFSNDQFAEVEQEKRQRQILNIKKILNELYERREKKILAMALSKSRMPKSVIDLSNLAENEKHLYDKLISMLNEARSDALRHLVPEGSIIIQPEPEPPKPEPRVEEPEDAPKMPISSLPDGMQKIRFISDVSQFVGPNLEIYGPFRAEDTAVLPASVCSVLFNKNKAEPSGD